MIKAVNRRIKVAIVMLVSTREVVPKVYPLFFLIFVNAKPPRTKIANALLPIINGSPCDPPPSFSRMLSAITGMLLTIALNAKEDILPHSFLMMWMSSSLNYFISSN